MPTAVTATPITVILRPFFALPGPAYRAAIRHRMEGLTLSACRGVDVGVDVAVVAERGALTTLRQINVSGLCCAMSPASRTVPGGSGPHGCWFPARPSRNMQRDLHPSDEHTPSDAHAIPAEQAGCCRKPLEHSAERRSRFDLRPSLMCHQFSLIPVPALVPVGRSRSDRSRVQTSQES